MLYAGEAGSYRLRIHIRDCAGESGIRSGRGPAARAGRVPLCAASTATARAATVLASKRTRTGRVTESSVPTRPITRVALREFPPMSKKSSVMLTWSTARTSPKIRPINSSVFVTGATYAFRRIVGAGSARKSTFPAGVNGISSRTITEEGTMCAGSRLETKVRTSSGSR